jgi:cytoskeletal protein CcmA (bactofilin family)
MPPLKPDKIAVTCPRCGHCQLEPRTAYSSICKQCHQHFRLEQVQRLPAPLARPQLEPKQVRCFHCAAELTVPVAATSTICKRCRSHVDLANYRVTQTLSKKLRTHGRLVIEERGFLFDSEALVGEALVKGRFIGRLVAEGTLEINSSADIKGNITAGRLMIPAGHHFNWPEPLPVEAADISGELVTTLQASGTVWLRATARFFGVVKARNLVVELGAVFVGTAQIGDRLWQETNGHAPS